MSALRVLALTHRTPFPPDKGDKIRTHNLLTRVARGAEVHVMAFAEPPSDARHSARLRRSFASVTLVPLDMRWQRLRALASLASREPLTLPAFRSAAMRDEVARAVRELRPDVIFAESSSMAPYALAHPEVPLVMDFVDADSAKWSAYAEKALGPKRWVYLREARTLARYERAVAEAAAVSLVTAERERGLFATIAPGCDVRALPNGVDTDFFSPATCAPTRGAVVFHGAMDYGANVEAAEFLVRDVLPRVRAKAPWATVTLAGSNPSPEVRRLAETPGVTVTGYVTDIRPWVRGASVCAVPLRVARGVQNKVLEAMAMGVPVLCSPAAAEGIDATTGTDLEVARVDDGGEAYASALLGLLEDGERRAVLGAAGRGCVAERYGWEPRASELLELLREAAVSAPSARG